METYVTSSADWDERPALIVCAPLSNTIIGRDDIFQLLYQPKMHQDLLTLRSREGFVVAFGGTLCATWSRPALAIASNRTLG
jgi:hypothetical protein